MKHWTDYWKSTNALNSFAEGKQGTGYQEEVSEFWITQFQAISNDSLVVDLGTGNGAVAVLAQNFSNQQQRNWQVFALDVADIEPQKLKVKDKNTQHCLQQINFIANTPIEEAPFEPNSIDAFISQFAFEYSNLEQSIKHCAECLKPGASLNILAHHPESDISKDSLVGAKVLNYILKESPVFMQIDLLLEIATQQTQAGQMHNWSSNPYRNVISNTVRWIFDQLTFRFGNNSRDEFWCKSTIARLAEILNQIGKTHPSQLRQQLQLTYDQLESHLLRLNDQNSACLSKQRLETIEKLCVKYNLSLQIAPVTIENSLFAYHLVMTK